MNDLQQDTLLEINVINHFCTFAYLLEYAGISFPDRTTSCFCPFHDNTNTKAAKLFCEQNNEHLFCFAENKQYRPHHLLTNHIVPFTVQHVFSAIWSNLSDSEKSIFSDYTRNHTIENDFSSYYKDYKKGKLKYFDLLTVLRNS